MSTKEDEFLKQLRATFKVEAAEHLQAIAAGLLELEKTPAPEAQRKIVETVFRAAHSLKGAARAVDFTEIESLCQSLEDVFAAWKRQESAPSAAALNTLHRTLDAITAAMSAPEATRGAPAPAARPSVGQPIRHPEVSVPASAEVPPAPVTEQKTFPRRNRAYHRRQTGCAVGGSGGDAHGETDHRPAGGRLAGTGAPLRGVAKRMGGGRTGGACTPPGD